MLLMSSLFSSVCYATFIRNLSETELEASNWIIQCPKELVQMTDQGGIISTGEFISDMGASTYSYKFYRQRSFESSEYLGSLVITRKYLFNPPQDGPAYRVICEVKQ